MDMPINGLPAPGAPKPCDEVVNLLAKYLAEAKAGKWQFVGLVLADTPTNVVTDMAGKNGLQFAISFGIDHLKEQVRELIKPRETVQIARPTLVVPGR